MRDLEEWKSLMKTKREQCSTSTHVYIAPMCRRSALQHRPLHIPPAEAKMAHVITVKH